MMEDMSNINRDNTPTFLQQKQDEKQARLAIIFAELRRDTVNMNDAFANQLELLEELLRGEIKQAEQNNYAHELSPLSVAEELQSVLNTIQDSDVSIHDKINKADDLLNKSRGTRMGPAGRAIYNSVAHIIVAAVIVAAMFFIATTAYALLIGIPLTSAYAIAAASTALRAQGALIYAITTKELRKEGVTYKTPRNVKRESAVRAIRDSLKENMQVSDKQSSQINHASFFRADNTLNESSEVMDNDNQSTISLSAAT